MDMSETRFKPRLSDDEVRTAARRVATGESHRAVARSLGIDPSALRQRIRKLEARAAAEAHDLRADRAVHDAEKKRVARGIRTGYAEIARTSDRPEERGGATIQDEVARVSAELERDGEVRRARLREEERAKAEERADRRARFGFPTASGKVYKDGEAQWLQDKDDRTIAALEHAERHPEIAERHSLFALDGSWIASKSAGLTSDELDAWAETFVPKHGPVEIRAGGRKGS
jgi:hypothetical protein